MPYLIFIFSLLAPIYALGFAIVDSIKKNSSYLSLVSIALAFSTVAYTLIPSEELDLYRHYQRIDIIQSLPFNNIFTLNFDGYYLFDLYSWILGYFHIPKPFFTASVVFTGYYLILLIYNDIKKKMLSGSKRSTLLLALLIFLLSIDFIFLATGIRNVLANTIVFYVSYYVIYYKKYLLFALGIAIAFLIHPASLMPSFLTICTLIFPWLSKYTRYLVIAAFLLMIGNKVFTILISYIQPILQILPFYDSVYFDPNSNWGGGFKESASTRGWIASVIIYRLPTYVGMTYLLITNPKIKSKLLSLICLTLLILGLVFSFQTVFARLNYFFIYLFAVLIVLEYKRNRSRINYWFMIIYLFSLLSIWLVNIIAFDFYLTSSIEYLYKPLVFILAGI